jgi:hypothetical protein
MIWLLLSISDWLIIMIGTGGFLVVVPHLFSVPVSVLWMGLQNYLNNYTWMWKIFWQGHILSTAGDALYTHKSKNRKVIKLLWESEQGLLLDPSWIDTAFWTALQFNNLPYLLKSLASQWHSANTVLEKEANIGSVSYYCQHFLLMGKMWRNSLHGIWSGDNYTENWRVFFWRWNHQMLREYTHSTVIQFQSFFCRWNHPE